MDGVLLRAGKRGSASDKLVQLRVVLAADSGQGAGDGVLVHLEVVAQGVQRGIEITQFGVQVAEQDNGILGKHE